MKKLKASDLKPGRELDALVAEKVMGWHWLNDGHPLNVKHVANHRHDRDGCSGKIICSPDADWYCVECQSGLPYYSDDMEDTRKMEDRISEMHLEGCYVQELVWLEKWTGRGYFPNKWSEWFFIVHAGPFQRCVAALLAVQAVESTEGES